MPKCDFNKVALLFLRTPLEGYFCSNLIQNIQLLFNQLQRKPITSCLCYRSSDHLMG